jgi:hypothetical protein
MKSPVLPLAAAALASWALVTPAASGQAEEAFTATASVKTKNVSATAPASITISRWSTEAERASVNGALKSGGNHAAKEALAKMSDCGKLEMGENHVPIKYAVARSTGSGRVIVLATADPLLHTASGLPEAKPKSKNDVAVVILVVDANNTGHGELAAAAQVKTTASGAITIDHYDAPKIWLKDVAKAR